MFDLVGRFIQNITTLEIIMVFICMGITLIFLAVILTNMIDWVVTIYYYSKTGWFQLSYPNYEDRIIKINYEPYILGEQTGEIFYIDSKKLKKLKRKELIHWNDKTSCHVFRDSEVDEVKNIINPNKHAKNNTININE